MFKKISYSFCLLILVSHFSMGQSTKIDSLNKEIQILKLKAQVDSLKAANVKAQTVSQSVSNEEYAARQDELKNEILKLKGELKDTKDNLVRFQRQYRTGTGLFFGGIALLVFTAVLSSSNGSNTPIGNGLRIAGTVGGIGLNLVGQILWLDAHRHIGKAGGLQRNVINY